MLERETEGRADADQMREPSGETPIRRARAAMQRGVGEGADQHDLLALADVHPGQSRQSISAA